MRGTDVDEVDRLAVDRSAEVRELVEARLLGSPVVRVAPVLHQLAHVVHWDPVLPAGVLDLIGEAGLRQTAAQFLQVRIVDLDPEALDDLAHLWLTGMAVPRSGDLGPRAGLLAAQVELRLFAADRHAVDQHVPHAGGLLGR